MELKAAVCDDSAADRYLVSQMLRKTAEDMGIPVRIYEYTSGEELMKDISRRMIFFFWIYRCREWMAGKRRENSVHRTKCGACFCNRGDYAHTGYVPGLSLPLSSEAGAGRQRPGGYGGYSSGGPEASGKGLS